MRSILRDIRAVVDWLTERCEFHADAKSNLAVLHNRNDMTNLFRASNWGSSSQDTMPPWSFLTMTLNPSWHQDFGSFRFTGHCSTVHVATDQVQHLRELGVAQAWLSLSARKTRSREERESFMRVCHTPTTEEASPSGLGRAAWSTRCMYGFQQAGRHWLQSGCLVYRPIQGSFLTILSMDSLL